MAKLSMIHIINLKNISITLSLLSAVFFQGQTLAAKNDIGQQITIESQRQSADLKNKIVSYLDDVVIRQGSLIITAEIVQISSKEVNKKDDKTYLATGKPAIFQQQLDDGSLITLQADEIKYQPDLFLITVSGNALVKQAGSEVTGSKIIFNTETEKLDAESNTFDKVTTVLQPTALKTQKEKNESNKKDDQNNN